MKIGNQGAASFPLYARFPSVQSGTFGESAYKTASLFPLSAFKNYLLTQLPIYLFEGCFLSYDEFVRALSKRAIYGTFGESAYKGKLDLSYGFKGVKESCLGEWKIGRRRGCVK